MRAFLSKLRKDITGNVMLLSGAGVVALIGGAGLGVDTVEWYLWKRQLQQSVDSGAIAGANALRQGSSVRTYASKEVKRNANTDVVIRYIGTPKTGAYTGDTSAVAVIATTQQALSFSSIFVDAAPTLRARAVATTVTDGEFCIYTLAPSGVGVHIAGTANVQLGCGVNANSRDLYAINFDGGGHLSGSPLSAVGGIQYDSTNIDAGTDIQAYGVEQDDPLAGKYKMSDIPSPPPGGCDYTNYTVQVPETKTLGVESVGVRRGYRFLCNGLTVRGKLTLEPGVYVINGGEFRVNSTAKITGEGVTIILTGNSPATVATVNMQGGATVDLRAPNEADEPWPGFWPKEWWGMLLFQDPKAAISTTTNTNRFAGDSGSSWNGIVYMPNADLTLTGSSGQTSECLLLVTYRLDVSGETTVGNSCPTEISDVDNSARIVRLVE